MYKQGLTLLLCTTLCTTLLSLTACQPQVQPTLASTTDSAPTPTADPTTAQSPNAAPTDNPELAAANAKIAELEAQLANATPTDPTTPADPTDTPTLDPIQITDLRFFITAGDSLKAAYKITNPTPYELDVFSLDIRIYDPDNVAVIDHFIGFWNEADLPPNETQAFETILDLSPTDAPYYTALTESQCTYKLTLAHYEFTDSELAPTLDPTFPLEGTLILSANPE